MNTELLNIIYGGVISTPYASDIYLKDASFTVGTGKMLDAVIYLSKDKDYYCSVPAEMVDGEIEIFEPQLIEFHTPEEAYDTMQELLDEIIGGKVFSRFHNINVDQLLLFKKYTQDCGFDIASDGKGHLVLHYDIDLYEPEEIEERINLIFSDEEIGFIDSKGTIVVFFDA